MNESIDSSALDYLPRSLREKLMPFQIEGVLFGIRKDGRCLIADEMGLGKTIQALSLAYHFRPEWPLLIIVPSSLCYPWVEEVEKWFPDILPEDINVIETGSDVGKISSSLITIVTYGLLRHSASHLVHDALSNQHFKVIIVDESHYIKNRQAASTKYIVPLVQEAERRILLTGTPALNRPEELFAQLDAICPGAFGGWTQFAKQYCDAKFKFLGRRRLWTTDGASNLGELHNRLSDLVMVRRLKKNVLTQLPPKRRQKITFKLKESDVKKQLDGLWEDLEKVLRQGKTSVEQAFMNVGPGMLSAPSNSIETYKLLSQLYVKTCEAKIGPVKEYIRFLCDTTEQKFIVFSFHRSMTDAIVEQLIESKLKFIRIDGSTPVSDRPHLVSKFQSDEDTRVAVLSIKAAGVGLTLTAASLVVFAELDWTPGVLEQCEDRAHRIGQKCSVDIHYLVAAQSLDEWVWSALSRKTIVVAAALNNEKKYLRMKKGTIEQVNCLTNAEPYLPSENTETDFTCLLQTQLNGQKTVLDYFSSQKDKSTVASDSCPEAGSPFPVSPTSSNPSSDVSFPLSSSKVQSQNPSTSTPVSKHKCIVIESDEEEVFDEQSFLTRKAFEQRQKKPSIFCLKRKRDRTSKIRGKCLEKDNLEDSHWSCAVCTFVNLDVIPSCEMCLTPKTKRLKGTAEHSNCTDETLNDSKEIEHDVSVGFNDLVDLCSKKSRRSEFRENVEIENDNELNNEFNAEFLVKETLCLDNMLENNVLSQNINQKPLMSDNSPSACVQNASLDQGKCVIQSETLNTKDELSKAGERGLLSVDDEDGEDERLFEACCSYLSNCDEEQENCLKKEGLEMVKVEDGTEAEPSFVDSSMLEELQSDVPDCSDLKDEEVLDDNLDSAASNWDDVEVHSSFQFSCSRHTSRIYVYDQAGISLRMSFIPYDVEMKNFSDLSRFFLHPRHLELLKRFVREWNRLSQTKRRLIARSGLVFMSPSVIYEQIRSGKVLSKQRYATKADVSALSVSSVAANGGSLRVITKTNGIVLGDNLPSEVNDETNLFKGFVQALAQEGNPLCLNCQKPFVTSLISQKVLEKHPWQTRLCSQNCFKSFWIKHNQRYSVQEVYSLEHGVCQLCSFDSHSFYENIKATRSFEKRAKMIQDSRYSVLSTECKEKMVTTPTQGLFWNVDHILPVSEGGGECDIDNLRTLCTVCHRDVTRQQNKDRPKQRLRQAAAACQSITSFFRPLK